MPLPRVALVLSRHIHARGHRVDVVAPRMGVSESQLYKYLEGETPFPLERLPSLFVACDRDMELLCDLLAVDTLGLVVTEQADEATAESVTHLALATSAAAGEVSAATSKAVSDGVVTVAEADEVVRKIGWLHRWAQKLRFSVRRAAA
jgi:hypothetical protein